jgi:hypothetical protein
MTDALAWLAWFYGLDWLWALPAWGANLVIGLQIAALIGFAAFASVKMGLTPLWTLLLVVPTVSVPVLWVVAYLRWPRVDGASPARRRAVF